MKTAIALLVLCIAHIQSKPAYRGKHQDVQPKDLDPEATMRVDEVIQYYGYPVEINVITTTDGYILKLHRIPAGRGQDPSIPRTPVLVQHGLVSSAFDWVANPAGEDLAFLLADAGYDVWLGNFRGNTYSRNHVSLDPDNDLDFWHFSWDEMGKYDLPAMIDHILTKTNHDQLYYVGHSMGTTTMFTLLSTQLEYNNKIKAFFALAPIAYVGHMKSPIHLIAPYADSVGNVADWLGIGEFFPSDAIMHTVADTVCNSAIDAVCSSVAFLMCGTDTSQLNETRLPVYVNHTPAGASTQTIVHYGQLVNTQNFQMYDHGTEDNLALYGQETPPEYNVSKITAPVALMYGNNDWLGVPEDVAILAPQLQSMFMKYRVPLDDWSHLDFLWALQGNTLLYDKVIDIMRQFDNPERAKPL